MKAQHTLPLLLATLTMGSAHAAITTSDPNLVVSDHAQGATPTTFYDSLTNRATGNAPTTTGSNRTSLDAPGDVSGQTFTLASAITLHSIYLGYNDQQSSGTFNLRIDIGNDGTLDYDSTITLGTTSDLQTGGANGGPFHFIQFDLSAANIALAAGTHNFSVLGVTDNGEGAFLFAPTFGNDDYAGGTRLFSSNGSNNTASGDSFFAITSIPEPSTGLFVLFASSALLLRRRRA